MTFDEFTRRPRTLEGKILLQAIAILSGQPRFKKMSLDEVFAFVETRVANTEAMG